MLFVVAVGIALTVAPMAWRSCSPAPAPASPRGHLRLAAAADLNAAFGELIIRFGAAHDVDVSVSYGSSGTFYAQPSIRRRSTCSCRLTSRIPTSSRRRA